MVFGFHYFCRVYFICATGGGGGDISTCILVEWSTVNFYIIVMIY